MLCPQSSFVDAPLELDPSATVFHYAFTLYSSKLLKKGVGADDQVRGNEGIQARGRYRPFIQA